MSRTKHKRPSGEARAMEMALAKLAERAVHAEARALAAEAERNALANQVAKLKTELYELEWEKRRLWLVMWTQAGVKAKTLVKFRVEILRESLEEAQRLVYSGRWNYTLNGIDDVKTLEVVLPERPTGL